MSIPRDIRERAPSDATELAQVPIQDLIAAKRDDRELGGREIDSFVLGLVDGSVTDAQASAMAMAILLKGMSNRERLALTRAMRDSGRVLEWRLDGPVLDKHSTGGVGDCVSLVLAPALAACGAYVPMISGRGLGHTGGTLDKLEAIPGYRTSVETDEFRAVVAGVGCAIVGQTDDITPADRRLYAIRDETATVPSIDLITASILSKKLAAGLGGLVLDVKVGSGAFCSTMDEAKRLAECLVNVAVRSGCPARAVLSAMDQPLAGNAGNALEITAAVDVLVGAGQGQQRLLELCAELGGELLALGGVAEGREGGASLLRDAVASGRAGEAFARMVSALGGPTDLLENPNRHLARAPVRRQVTAPGPGQVQSIDARALGRAVVRLGGGRRDSSDRIDHSVGLEGIAAVGTHVEAGDPLATVHARSQDDFDAAAREIASAFVVGEEPRPGLPLVMETVALDAVAGHEAASPSPDRSASGC